MDKSWDDLLDLLDPKRPIPKQTKSRGAIEFWREWDAIRGKAVWVKRYIASGAYDLQAFNAAEIEWLLQLAGANVVNTYRRASLEQEGTKLAEPASTTIKTFDCGPTLDDWLRNKVRVDGHAQAHCFVQPEAFLRMAQSVLLALEQVNARHFVHCDLHPGNITLPISLLGRFEDIVRILPHWEGITLIDFGYSIDTRRPPKTTLPILHTGDEVRISPHLQSILLRVEREACSLLQPGQAWADVWLDPSWWYKLPKSPLTAFNRLDWREDLYQLGRMLMDIRDGVGGASHLGGRTVRESIRVASVTKMVNELPEHLMQMGLAQERPTSRPHQHIAERIQRVLYESKSAGIDCLSEFELHKADYLLNPVVPRAVQTPLVAKLSRRSAPAWERHAPDLPLPTIRPPSRIKSVTRLTSERQVRDESPINAKHSAVAVYQKAVQPTEGGRVIAALLVVGVVLLGISVTYAISTKDAGVVYLPPSSPAGVTAAVYPPPASSVPSRDDPVPQLIPAPSPVQAELRAQKLAQVLGLAVVNENYSGGRSIEVKLIDFEIGASPAYKLVVDISWRGSFLGQEGYQAKGVISVFSDGEMAPALGRDANWNPSWISDQLSAWLAARGMGRQLLSRPQQQ